MKKYTITYWHGKNLESALIAGDTPEEAVQKLIDHVKCCGHKDIVNVNFIATVEEVK